MSVHVKFRPRSHQQGASAGSNFDAHPDATGPSPKVPNNVTVEHMVGDKETGRQTSALYVAIKYRYYKKSNIQSTSNTLRRVGSHLQQDSLKLVNRIRLRRVFAQPTDFLFDPEEQ